MQVIAAKTRLTDVPAALRKRRLTLGDAATLIEEPDGAVRAYGAVPRGMLGRWMKPRQVYIGALDPKIAETVMPHLKGSRRYRVRLVDVPGPFQRGQPQVSLSIWAQVPGDRRERLDRPAELPDWLRKPF